LIAEHKREFGLDTIASDATASTTSAAPATESTPLTGVAGGDVSTQAKGMFEQVTSAVQVGHISCSTADSRLMDLTVVEHFHPGL